MLVRSVEQDPFGCPEIGILPQFLEGRIDVLHGLPVVSGFEIDEGEVPLCQDVRLHSGEGSLRDFQMLVLLGIRPFPEPIKAPGEEVMKAADPHEDFIAFLPRGFEAQDLGEDFPFLAAQQRIRSGDAGLWYPHDLEQGAVCFRFVRGTVQDSLGKGLCSHALGR